MPYVPPCTSIQSPTVAPLPLPTFKSTSLENDSDKRAATAQPNEEPSIAESSTVESDTIADIPASLPVESTVKSNLTTIPTTNSIPSTFPGTNRTASLSLLADRTPPLPLPLTNMHVNSLINNFAAAGLGQSDSVVPTLKDVREAESIGIPGVARRGTLGEKDMPRLPGQVGLAGIEGVQDGADGQVSAERDREREQVPVHTQEEEAEHDRRDSSTSLPDLVHSRTGENSSTSLDTLGDGDSPLSPDGSGQLGAEGQGDQVVIVGGAGEGEEQDPKVLALHRYKEGLYTYTVCLLTSRHPPTVFSLRRSSSPLFLTRAILSQREMLQGVDIVNTPSFGSKAGSPRGRGKRGI